ncbi:Hypothetical predicted protein, partial [Paramuricea clavata]
MSDTCPTAFQSFLKWKLGVQSPSLAYAAKDMARTVLFAVNIPYPLLKARHGILVKSGTTFSELSRDNNIDNNSINIEQCSFVDLFEYAIPGNSVAISPEDIKKENKKALKSYLVKKKVPNNNEPVQVKISGDGARMTRNSNFILLSFALLQDTDDVMAAKGNHTIGVVNGKEDYESLERCFKDIFTDINELVLDKKIDVDGQTINLEFFLGGDYKFILLLLGLSGATSNYACSWCKVHKDERWNMKYDLEYYSSSKLKRTLEDLKKSATKSSKESYCSVRKPLLNIELDHVIPDELHLLLRIMDVLINNL